MENLLSEKRSAILSRWYDTILETYPAETAVYLRSQENRFANPVGHSITHGIEAIFDDLMRGLDVERVSPFLDTIIRIRAVQDMTPSQAVSFIFSLKKVIREEIALDAQGDFPWQDLLALESAIDVLAVLSFDIFVKCREKLYDLKANEMRKMTFRLLQRVNTVGDEKEGSPEFATGDIDNDKQKEVPQ
ncbi:MAG: RsbRD N-terminal domain-containing protein [Nitrospirae bacterium]|nr:RsbRD N-terminal domain-containing protein [Nitrospirota bacterium]